MAAKLQCEICGGKLIGKPGGIFECENCGTEFSTEWAKAKLQEITGTVKVEGTVQIQGKVHVEGPVKVENAVSKESLLKLGNNALEDGKWDKASDYYEQVLRIDAENAEAYLGLALVEAKCRELREVGGIIPTPDAIRNFESGAAFRRFLQYASQEQKKPVLHKLGLSKQFAAEWQEKRTAEREKREREALAEHEKREREALAKQQQKRDELAEVRDRAKLLQDRIIIEFPGHVYAVKSDGTVLCTDQYRQEQVGAWRHVTQLVEAVGVYGKTEFAGYRGWPWKIRKPENQKSFLEEHAYFRWTGVKKLHWVSYGGAVGLMQDGSVKAFIEADARDDVRSALEKAAKWADIKQLACVHKYIGNKEFTIYGLRKDGVILCTAASDPLAGRSEIRELFTDGYHIAALTSAGRALDDFGHEICTEYSQNDRRMWTSIVSVCHACGEWFGLTTDGEIKARGEYKSGYSYKSRGLAFAGVKDIVSIVGGKDYLLYLDKNGRVHLYSEGERKNTSGSGQQNNLEEVWNWKQQIVAVYAYESSVLGLRNDGTVVCAGDKTEEWKTTAQWKLFGSLDTLQDELAQDRAAALADAKTELQIAETQKQQKQTELANVKGLFANKRRIELEADLAILDETILQIKNNLEATGN